MHIKSATLAAILVLASLNGVQAISFFPDRQCDGNSYVKRFICDNRGVCFGTCERYGNDSTPKHNSGPDKDNDDRKPTPPEQEGPPPEVDPQQPGGDQQQPA